MTDKTHTATAWTAADDCSGVTDPRYGQVAIVFHSDDDRDPLNNQSYIANPPTKSFEMYAYDAQGRQTDVVKPVSLSETDAAITTTTTSYDEKGRIATVIMNHRNGATTDTQTNIKFIFHYDSHGNRQEVVYPSGVIKQWNYKYNDNDELTSMTETQVGPRDPDPNRAPDSWKTTTYDPATGLSTALIDAAGNMIVNYYDSEQRLERKRYWQAMTPVRGVDFTYDSESEQLTELLTRAYVPGDGQVHEVPDGLYGETRAYDKETGGLAEVGKSVDGQGIGKLSYAYNNTGALASIAWLGRSVAYNYDEFGRLKTVRSNEADWEYTYAPCGKKATVHNTRANEIETREYDGLGRLKSILHKNANITAVDEGIIYNIKYVLGPDGNRVGAFERRQTATDDIATSWSYAYDALGRLISERRTIDNHYDGSFNGVVDRNVTYEYDCDSNRKKVVDYCAGTQEIYVHVLNTQRLHQVILGSGYKQYSWTANGEMAREDYYEGGDWDEETETYYEGGTLKSSQIYTWGFGGTLVEVRFEGGDNDGCKVNYIYDNENELIGRKVTLKTGAIEENERYLVDNLNPTGYSQRLAVLSKDGSIRHEIFTDELAAETTVNSGTANTQFMHGDGLGSIRALTGKSSGGENLGTDADRHFFDYTAFGSSLRGDRSLTNYAFTGQARDPNSGNEYHRARWMNTEQSVWLCNDSVFDFGNMGHGYIYASNNPINIIDYSGHMNFIETLGVAALIGSLATIPLTPMIKAYINDKSAWEIAGAGCHGVYEAIVGLIILGQQLVQYLITGDPNIIIYLISAIVMGLYTSIVEYFGLIRDAWNQGKYFAMALLVALLLATIASIFLPGPKNPS